LRDENSLLKRNDKNIIVVVARDVITATGTPVLQGITRACYKQIIHLGSIFPGDY
jgi:DNA-directed RNA polymerase subunit beta'